MPCWLEIVDVIKCTGAYADTLIITMSATLDCAVPRFAMPAPMPFSRISRIDAQVWRLVLEGYLWVLASDSAVQHQASEKRPAKVLMLLQQMLFDCMWSFSRLLLAPRIFRTVGF